MKIPTKLHLDFIHLITLYAATFSSFLRVSTQFSHANTHKTSLGFQPFDHPICSHLQLKGRCKAVRDCWRRLGEEAIRAMRKLRGAIREREGSRRWEEILLIHRKESRVGSHETLCYEGAFQVRLLWASSLSFSHCFILIFSYFFLALLCWLVWTSRATRFLCWIRLSTCMLYFGFVFFCRYLMHWSFPEFDI